MQIYVWRNSETIGHKKKKPWTLRNIRHTITVLALIASCIEQRRVAEKRKGISPTLLGPPQLIVDLSSTDDSIKLVPNHPG